MAASVSSTVTRLRPYVLVVATGAGLNFGIVWALGIWLGATTGVSYGLSAVFARLVANVWSFLGNERFTFADLRSASGRSAWGRFGRFMALGATTFVVYLVTGAGLVATGLEYRLATGAAIGAAFALSFLGNIGWVYRSPPASRQAQG